MIDHALADAGEFEKFFRSGDELFDGLREAFDEFGGFFVGAVAADDGAIDFEELRGFAEDASDAFVVHGGNCSAEIGWVGKEGGCGLIAEEESSRAEAQGAWRLNVGAEAASPLGSGKPDPRWAVRWKRDSFRKRCGKGRRSSLRGLRSE